MANKCQSSCAGWLLFTRLLLEKKGRAELVRREVLCFWVPNSTSSCSIHPQLPHWTLSLGTVSSLSFYILLLWASLTFLVWWLLWSVGPNQSYCSSQGGQLCLNSSLTRWYQLHPVLPTLDGHVLVVAGCKAPPCQSHGIDLVAFTLTPSVFG